MTPPPPLEVPPEPVEPLPLELPPDEVDPPAVVEPPVPLEPPVVPEPFVPPEVGVPPDSPPLDAALVVALTAPALVLSWPSPSTATTVYVYEVAAVRPVSLNAQVLLVPTGASSR